MNNQDKERIDDNIVKDSHTFQQWYNLNEKHGLSQDAVRLVALDAMEILESALTSAREEADSWKKELILSSKESIKLREENERLKKERDEDLIELLDYLLVENFSYYENQDGNTWFVEKSSGRKLTSEELLSEYKKSL